MLSDKTFSLSQDNDGGGAREEAQTPPESPGDLATHRQYILDYSLSLGMYIYINIIIIQTVRFLGSYPVKYPALIFYCTLVQICKGGGVEKLWVLGV